MKEYTPDKHGKTLGFVSNRPEVAKVNADGTVTAESEGTVVIYIQDLGSKWCRVEATIKKK